MKNIYILLAGLLLTLFPKNSNALKRVKEYQDDVSNFVSIEFNSPILMILNISAFVVLVLTIIWFMQGYTTKDLANGNLKEVEKGNKLIIKSAVGFLYILIVFIVDLNIY